MCGIFGVIIKEDSGCSSSLIRETIDRLFLFSESRGKQASGLFFSAPTVREYCKNAIPAHAFIRTPAYKLFWKNMLSQVQDSGPQIRAPLTVIGHTRLATHGSEQDGSNNQPLLKSTFAGVHNGIVVNSPDLQDCWAEKGNTVSSDSDVLLTTLDTFLSRGIDIREAVTKVYSVLEGSASIAGLVYEKNNVILATNTGSLYYGLNKNETVFVFASERPILEKLSRRKNLTGDFGNMTICHLPAGMGLILSVTDLQRESFSFGSPLSAVNADSSGDPDFFTVLLHDAKKRGGLEPDEHSLRRCTLCVLPETIPYITFDNDGVCNYCREHKKIKSKGEADLLKIAEPYRRDDGRPDCLVAFSGGRDSAYALHYVKRVLKMNPIAFTFDWGMVADIGRRNQARIVGKLGVEHLIISADINRQRRYIRENVKAWLKKPHLGMVVLFMAGDKPVEYLVRSVAKQHDIGLIFLARGNEFENTDFKWGFLGMPRGEPGGVLHDLSFGGRVRFSVNAFSHFLRNPRYFNKSLADTFFAYWTTYVLRYDFNYIWHYIDWDEAQIVHTLRTEYNWETAEDTIQTWRTDDGTSPFYNYIYYTLAGFTENDAFRSNQIREGILSREDALCLVRSENQPRREAIRDYLEKIGLDYTEVTKTIETMPRLYKR
jgi:glutamine---fructose-6-phosphate transaminase (isomerizing)